MLSCTDLHLFCSWMWKWINALSRLRTVLWLHARPNIRLLLQVRSISSRHITLKQHRFNVKNQRWIDVVSTSCAESTLNRRCFNVVCQLGSPATLAAAMGHTGLHTGILTLERSVRPNKGIYSNSLVLELVWSEIATRMGSSKYIMPCRK